MISRVKIKGLLILLGISLLGIPAGCRTASTRLTQQKPFNKSEQGVTLAQPQSINELQVTAYETSSEANSSSASDSPVKLAAGQSHLLPGLSLNNSKIENAPIKGNLSVTSKKDSSLPDLLSSDRNAASGEPGDSVSSKTEVLTTETIPESVLLNRVPSLVEVVESVRLHFPAIRQAEASRVIASGEALSAYGAFDRKLEGYSNGQPQDFYENNWHKWSLKRNTMWGGQVGAGYRIGRGSFEPWYKERETNDGGEFNITLSAPIGRDREIDSYRAELWRAQLERGRVEPFIRSQVIAAVREGSFAYWKWVAANENLRIANEVLKLGTDRVDLLTRQIELGEKAKIDLVDNRRIIVSRLAKQTDARRKLQQAAIKLSLYLRTSTGEPFALVDENLMNKYPEVRFPEITPNSSDFQRDDLAFAQANRPELAELNVLRQQVAIAYRQANNEMRPDVDAGLFLGQDVGNPTKDNDKSEFEVEATLTVSVPLERRKARGKLRQLSGKLAELRAKTQFASEKIATEVETARAALNAAKERVAQTSEGLDLARQIQTAELRLYEEGQSTLFNLNLREKQTAEAAAERVMANLDFHLAEAEYRASIGLDQINIGSESL